MDAYIISYFGKKLSTQWQRQALHYQQLSCLLKQPGIENIHILAQAYENDKIITKPKDYLKIPHPRIIYHDSEQITPGAARNKLMDIFYASGKSWALFADNDAIIDPRFHGRDICNIIEYNSEWLTQNIDILACVSPRHHCYNKYWDDETAKGNTATHTPIKRENYCKTTLFFLKNRSLIGKQPIYFDAELPQLIDFEYQGRVLANNGVIYQMRAVVMGDLGLDEKHSTLLEDRERTERFEQLKELIYKRYFDPADWRGADKTPFRWNQLGNNKLKQDNYKLPLPGQDPQVLLTQDNTYHSLFDE